MIKRLRNELKKEPTLRLTEPIGRIISSQVALFETNGLRMGRRISLTKDWMKLKEAKLTMNATETAMIRYSLRKILKPLKTMTRPYLFCLKSFS